MKIVAQNQSVPVSPSPTTLVQPTNQIGKKKKGIEVLRLLVRPFHSVTLLWCFLLLFTTHIWVLRVSLAVVLLQLGRKIFRLLEVVLFSGPLLREAGQRLMTRIDTIFAAVDLVTPESVPTAELKNLFLQLSVIEKVLRFLENRDLVVRWAWLLTLVFLAGVYSYMALLFSFVYFGVARVGGVAYSWPQAFVTSLFIPFFITDLPHIIWAKALGGIHCVLILTVGVGTIFTYIHRRLDSIRSEVTALSERLAHQSIRERYRILEEKAAVAPAKSPMPTDKTRADALQKQLHA
jgi:hypothetical protein